MNSKPKEIDANRLALRLRRLWVGTLYIGVFAVYTILVGLVLVYHGWRPALLSLFLIALIRLFRYVSDDVDRIGWLLKHKNIEGETAGIHQHRTRLQYLLATLIVMLNAALVYQMYIVSGWQHALAALGGLAAVETLCRLIRVANRRIDYKTPAYGIRHPGPMSPKPEISRLEEKLAQLKEMAARGDISKKAYEKVTDRVLIKQVMNEG